MVRPFATCVCTDDLLLFLVESWPTPVDFSKATRLKDVTFRVEFPGIEWVTAALQTVTSKHRDLRRILISLTYYSVDVLHGVNVERIVGKQIPGQWPELDRLLAQLWESHSIRPKILCYGLPSGGFISDVVGRLLPEATEEGIIDLVDGRRRT